MSRPSSRISPPLGWVKPPIIRRIVVLPEPDGPRMVMNSPSRTASSMPSRTAVGPKDFETDLSSRRMRSSVMDCLKSIARPAGCGGPGEESPKAYGVALISFQRSERLVGSSTSWRQTSLSFSPALA